MMQISQQKRRSLNNMRFWQINTNREDVEFLHVPRVSDTLKQRINFQHLKIFFRRGTKKDFRYNGSFQEAIGPVIVLAQVFALMPVSGVLQKSAQDLHFTWYSLRTIYALIAIAVFGMSSGFTIAFNTRAKFDFDTVETVIFYVSIFFIAISFFHLARKWPTLLIYWQDVEANLPAWNTEYERAAVAKHIKMITLVAMMCSLIEHLLSMLSNFHFVIACPVIPDKPIQSFLYINFSMFFYFIEYSNWMGWIGKIINILSTFAWNFNDIFVMTVSVALAARFRQLNDFMQRAAKGPTNEDFWIQCRINYRSLCKLCDAVDDAISAITLLCFSNNLYFICGKILRSLQKKPSIAHAAYFWFSLIYLLGRTFVLSLYTASINDESKRPLNIFRTISRQYWCTELKRFSLEVNSDVVALTGMKFFQLTRGVVISVAGTIVTYELILLQFNGNNEVNDCNKF